MTTSDTLLMAAPFLLWLAGALIREVYLHLNDVHAHIELPRKRFNPPVKPWRG